MEKMAEQCKLARVTRTFNKDVFRVQWSALPGTKMDDLSKILVWSLKKDGGEVKNGIEPKGPRERRLEAIFRKALNEEEKEETEEDDE